MFEENKMGMIVSNWMPKLGGKRDLSEEGNRVMHLWVYMTLPLYWALSSTLSYYLFLALKWWMTKWIMWLLLPFSSSQCTTWNSSLTLRSNYFKPSAGCLCSQGKRDAVLTLERLTVSGQECDKTSFGKYSVHLDREIRVFPGEGHSRQLPSR